MKTLVVGATGNLGMAAVHALRARGEAVRAMVRPTADPASRAALTTLGAEIVRGDLKEPSSLREACRGVDAILSTATATRSRQAGDSVESVDGLGQLSLVDAARAERVPHFVFVSMPPLERDCAVQRAKRAV
ncbi:MAG: NmrA family NAD(P)-binding protein, partial [Myxococcales bacterium]|nr:NmrA family NAD(P)-binding protein [Myxococcales bacterium]